MSARAIRREVASAGAALVAAACGGGGGIGGRGTGGCGVRRWRRRRRARHWWLRRAAVEAASLITEAGLTMISANNISLALTSDLQGDAAENRSVGYYRNSRNDLFQAGAVAPFVLSELGLGSAAVIHDGDPYTQALAHALADAFAAEGGVVTGSSWTARRSVTT